MIRPDVRRTVGLLALVIVAAACGGSKGGAESGAAAAPAPAGPKLPAGVTIAMIAQGDSIFNTASCQRCHGKGAVGAQNGPDLTAGKWQHGSGSYDDIVKTIMTGVPQAEIKDPSHRFNMRARGGVQPLLTDDQVKAVAAYVWSRSNKI